MKLSNRTSVVLVAGCGILLTVLFALESPTYYFWQQKRMVRRVLGADPRELRDAATALLIRRGHHQGEIQLSAPDIPSAIRRLKPTYITMSSNTLAVDFGDVFNPFGIIVYRPGTAPPPQGKWGKPPQQWVDGLWLYDDGQLETYGQPLRPANGG